MTSRQDRRCYRRFIRMFVPSFSLFQPFCYVSFPFSFARIQLEPRLKRWRARNFLFLLATRYEFHRLCRRPGHSAYLKCIVRRCAGGYVSVNVTEFQCPRKIVFHAEILMDPTPVSSLKIASGLFVEPWTINYFLKILSFLFIFNSLSFFFFLLDSRYSRAEKFASSREMLRAALKILASKRKLPIPLLCNYILRSIFSILPFDFVFHDNNRGSFFFLPSSSLL